MTWLIYDMQYIMYVLCMMLCIILNSTIHRGRTKKKIIVGSKTKVQVF